MRILSLDWDASYQLDLAAELEASGHEVETFSLADEALARRTSRPFDLFILETRLPDKNGLQFLRELKATGKPLPRVVFLTDVEEPEIRDLCLREGAARFLSKKDGWPAIVSEIHGVLSEFAPATAPPAPVRSGARVEARVFRGNVETIDLLDVIQLLSLGKKTGVLVLAGGPREGRMFFDDGEIIAARSEETTGEEAFSEILTIKRGTFRFEAGAIRTERTIHQLTSGLILDALRRQDEQGRKRHADAPGQAAAEPATAPSGPAPPSDLDIVGAAEEPAGDWLYTGISEEGMANDRPLEESHGRSHLPERDRIDASGGRAELGGGVQPGARGGERADPIREPRPLPSSTQPLGDWGGTGYPWGEARDREGSWNHPAMPGEPAQPSASWSTRQDGPESWRTEHEGLESWRTSANREDYTITPRWTSRSRSAALVGLAVVALLGSGYVIFSDMLQGGGQESAGHAFRARLLKSAAEQAQVDSLEQVLQQLSGGIVPSTEGVSASARIAYLEAEIRKASARRNAEESVGKGRVQSRRPRERTSATPRRREDAASEAAPIQPRGTLEKQETETIVGAIGPQEWREVAETEEVGAALVRGGSATPMASAEGSAGRSAREAGISSAVEAAQPPDTGRALKSQERDIPAAPASDAPAPDSEYALESLRRGPRFVPVDVPPTLTTPLAAQSPTGMTPVNAGSTVTLWVLVSASGVATDVRVLRSSGHNGLDALAADAVRRASYTPARRKGAPASAWIQQRIAFKLE
jgi:TonB family protein